MGWPSATAPPLIFTFARVELQVADHRQRLHRKGFVELKQVN
jgi:hypothetical protein